MKTTVLGAVVTFALGLLGAWIKNRFMTPLSPEQQVAKTEAAMRQADVQAGQASQADRLKRLDGGNA